MSSFFITCWFHVSSQRIRVLVGMCMILMIVAIPIYSQTSQDIQLAITNAESSIGNSVPSYSFPTEGTNVFEYPASSQVWNDVLSGKIGNQYLYWLDDAKIVEQVTCIVAGLADNIHDAHDTVASDLNTMFSGDMTSALSRLEKSESSNYLEALKSLKCTIEPGISWRDGIYIIQLNDIAVNGPGYYFSILITKDSEE